MAIELPTKKHSDEKAYLFTASTVVSNFWKSICERGGTVLGDSYCTVVRIIETHTHKGCFGFHLKSTVREKEREEQTGRRREREGEGHFERPTVQKEAMKQRKNRDTTLSRRISLN